MGDPPDYTGGKRKTRITRAAREAATAYTTAIATDESDHRKFFTRHNFVDEDHPFWKWVFPELGYVIILEVDRDDNPSNLLVRTRYIQNRTGHREVPLRDPILERYVFAAHQLGGEHTADIATLVRIILETLEEIEVVATSARRLS